MPDGSVLRRTEYLREQYRDGGNLSARMRLHARFSTNKYGFFRWLFDRIEIPADARVLELGSGTGEFWARNADRIPAGWQIALSDRFDGMLGETRARIARIDHAFALMLIDAQALPFRDHSVDAIIASHMLYHVPDIPLALREFRRVLKPGGHCYAATMGRANMAELDSYASRFLNVDAMTLATARFGLENGETLMRQSFGSVDVVRYPDSLEITDAGPVMDYLNSTRVRLRVSDEQLATMRREIESQIAAHGALHVTKDSGVLVGTP